MACDYIKYNDISSNDVISTSLVLCFADYSNDAVAITREIQKGDTTYLRPVANHYGAIYSDAPIFKFGLAKSDFTEFTISEKRAINKWLTSSSTPKKLEIFADDWDSNIYFKCVATEIDYVRRNGTVMIEVSFQCDSYFGYTKKVYEYGENKKEFIVNCDSDLELGVYTYPVITIEFLSSGELTIFNATDNGRSMRICALTGLTAVIDCNKYLLTDNAGDVLKIADLFILDDDTDVYWLRLLSGDNRIVLDNNCRIKFEFEELLKVGVPNDFSV